jgi:hypothetical protein
MAPVVVPILSGVGAASVATAVGASALTSAVVGATAAVGVSSLMNAPSPQAMVAPVTEVPVVDTVATDTTPVDTSGATGGAETTINDVAAVQEDVATQADTTPAAQTPVTEEVVGTTVDKTPAGGGGTIVSVNEQTQEAIVDVKPGTTTQGGVQTGGPTSTSAGTAGGGTAEAVVATTQSVGPAEDEAISFYEKGRRATILTGAQGLLSEQSTGLGSPFRGRRSLVGQGLIA